MSPRRHGMTDAQARARVWTLCLAALVLAALTGPLVTLLTPLAHASSTALHVIAAVLAALRVGARAAPATLQLKADGVFVSIRGRDLFDITQALDALPVQLARLDTRREERRLVYSEGVWRIDP